MWMIGEAGWEGIVIQSRRSRMARAAQTFSWRVSRMDGVLRRMLIPSEALTARRAGREAEKTKEGPLMRCGNKRNGMRNLVCYISTSTNLVVDDISGTSTESSR